MRTWFTADTHFGHKNIIKYCNRPFKDLKEMNATLIKNWNERVSPNDIVIVLGDFAWEKDYSKIKERYLDKLNGNILIVRGNHDYSTLPFPNIFGLVIENDKEEMYCTHNPIDVNTAYKTNFVGHVHDLWKTKDVVCGETKTKLINVGVDVNNFYPISLECFSFFVLGAVLMFFVFTLALAAGYRTGLSFGSSMLPAFSECGIYIMDTKTEPQNVNDFEIIAFSTPYPINVSHRVLSNLKKSEQFLTKGDGNKRIDGLIEYKNFIGVVRVNIPIPKEICERKAIKVFPERRISTALRIPRIRALT